MVTWAQGLPSNQINKYTIDSSVWTVAQSEALFRAGVFWWAFPALGLFYQSAVTYWHVWGTKSLFLITLSNPHLVSESDAVSQEVMEREEDNFDAVCVFDSIYICILLIRG